jgi:hypothetical protein
VKIVKTTLTVSGAIVVAVFLIAADYPPALAYFTNTRQVGTVPEQEQNFIVLDDFVWAHARPDLSDLRLYDGETQVPYALREQRSGVSGVEQAVKILNLSTVARHTEFDLDTSDVPEYNRIELLLTSRDFVATTQVEGRNDLRQRQGARLGSSTLYDFTREGLGSNSVLKLPLCSFRYLHVRLGSGISPSQIKGAAISKLEERKAVWRNVGSCRPAATSPKVTTMICSTPASVPVERVAVEIPSERVNFRRNLMVENLAGTEVTRGEISRIRLVRGGQSIVNENLAVDLPSVRSDQFTVTIENGDDVPLPVRAVQLLSVERRLYFNPEGKTSLSFYCGDAKLDTPTYDYNKFFREDPAAAQAKLGSDQHNPAYTGRPDERPWSERHPSVLWLAMLAAVALLGLLALRGFIQKPNRGTPS